MSALRTLFRVCQQNLVPLRNKVKITLIQTDKTFEVDALVGRNLMNALEKTVNKPVDEEVFGLCGGDLDCCTCGVHVLNKIETLEAPDAEEIKILKELKDYKEGVTRMACQIIVSEKHEGLKVELPAATIKEIEKQLE